MEKTHETTITIDSEEVDVTILYEVEGQYIPGKYSGPPENCYPSEHPEALVLKITRDDTGEELDEELVWPTKEERWDFENKMLEQHAEEQMDAAMDYAADTAYDRHLDR